MGVASYRSVSLALLAAIVAFASPAWVAAQTTPVRVDGRVMDADGQPVPCCDVLVTVRDGQGQVTSQTRATTRGDGSFSASVDCNTGAAAQFLTATPQCCQGQSDTVDITGCVDPGTGDPLTRVDLGDISCQGPATTGHTLLTGRVVCRVGLFLEPVSGCAVLIRDATGRPVTVTRTNANGVWEACHPCPSPMGVDVAFVEAQCCETTRQVTLVDCPSRADAGTMICNDCPVPPCSDAGHVVVTGLVTCMAPNGPIPVPGCDVALFVTGCNTSDTLVVTTDADGRYTACVACPAGGSCTDWVVQAQARCCGGGTGFQVVGCPNRIEFQDIQCAPTGVCPPVQRPCGTAATLVHGVVTCVDRFGATQPVVGCEIQIEGLNCPNSPRVVTAVTDQDGAYSACYDCAGCAGVRVTAVCCGTAVQQPLAGCPPEVTADLTCRSCPTVPPPRPCPPPDAVQVEGSVLCAPDGTPLAGCTVEIVGLDARGNVISNATALTDAGGAYRACLECGTGLALIRARARCCDAVTETRVTGCPNEVQLPTLACANCSPCPDGFTRLQGRVHCRNGGPVDACQVRIDVATCDGPVTLTTVTDGQGRYRLCIPCPCRGGVPEIRILAECCGAELRVPVADCRPVTPVPTIFCRRPCR